MKFTNHVLPTIPGLLLLLVAGCAAPSTPPLPAVDAAPTSAQAGGQTIVAIAAPSPPYSEETIYDVPRC